MNPPPFADVGAAPEPANLSAPLTERQRDLLAQFEAGWNNEDGIARCAAKFDQLSAEEREQIDAVGWGSRRPTKP